jgi:hypothetical protein
MQQPAEVQPGQERVPVSVEIGTKIAARQAAVTAAQQNLSSYLDGLVSMLGRPIETLTGLDAPNGVPVALIFNPPAALSEDDHE